MRNNQKYNFFGFAILLGLIAGSGSSVCLAAQTEAEDLTNIDNWPQIESPFPHDSQTEDYITKIINTMSLKEKVGQMIIVELPFINAEDLAKFPIGAVLNGGDSSPGGYKNTPLAEWVSLADKFHDIVKTRDGAYIPLLWGTDAVHGQNKIIGATIFPHNIGLGATHNPPLIRKIGVATAQEVIVSGQNWVFAPTLAVAQNYSWGRTYESYSSDPAIVEKIAPEIVKGLQGEIGIDFLSDRHVIATAKHFVGDGGTTDGRDQGNTSINEETLVKTHAAGYEPAIQAGVQTIMASYSSWNGVKMHENHYLIADVLKGRMGFDGFVVGDWNGHAQVPGCSKSSCPQAINAGVDMLMVTEPWKELYFNTIKQVENGEIHLERVDDAVRRILRVKYRAGLFNQPHPSLRPGGGDPSILGNMANRSLARQAVRQSLVLLKNQDDVLPIPANSRVLVVGKGANDIGMQSGGWTLTWQGGIDRNESFPKGESILQGLQRAIEASGGKVSFSENGDFTERPDYVVMVFGETPYAEMKGDINTLSFSQLNGQPLELLKKLKSASLPIISVFLSGRPLWVTPEMIHSDAFVAAWLPGTEGAGVADVLVRKPNGEINFDFEGRLSFPWPDSPEASELSKPLFPLDYGLRYQHEPTADKRLPKEN